MKRITLLICLILSFVTTINGKTIYVTTAGNDANSGLTWDAAYLSVQVAINNAAGGDEIWVAQGTYKPTTTTDRGISFQMKNNVTIYGGFTGIETSLGERNVSANPTTLSGNIGDAATDADNSYHVINNPAGLNGSAVLDGFTITGGNSNDKGGGMCNVDFCSPTIRNCTFSSNKAQNQGGGIYNDYYCSPNISNCIFTGNSALSSLAEGGGMYNYYSSPTISYCTFSSNTSQKDGGGIYCYSHCSPNINNCTFSNNYAQSNGGGLCTFVCSFTITNCSFDHNNATRGGGIFVQQNTVEIINCIFNSNASSTDGGGLANVFIGTLNLYSCIFINNNASGNGGGIYNKGRDDIPVTINITNCTLYGNHASNGGGIYNDYVSSSTIRNTIFWGDYITGSYTVSEITNITSTPSITYSCIQGGYAGTGNLSDDPVFVNAAGNDFHLQNGSKCIGTGTLISTPAYDIEGTLRNEPPDMGAYENPLVKPYIFVKSNASGLNNGTSWTNAYTSLYTALSNASSGNQVWVAAGTYKPTQTTDRNISFQMKNGVVIYGGFAGTETNLSDRNYVTNVTTLSGEIATASTNDNSYHVFNNPTGLNSTAILDGFTISNGYSTDFGGGIYNNNSSPAILNCTFSNNFAVKQGGGIANINNSSPAITSCTFTGNSSFFGGGIGNDGSSPSISNCTFNSNTAANKGGGIADTNNALAVISSCTFSNNNSNYYGGALCNIGCSPTISNCTFTGNTSSIYAGGIYNDNSSPLITNCNFTNNTSSGFGGAMFNITSSSPTITGCTFNCNIATAVSGAICIFSSSPTITNCVFSGNKSVGGNGGTLYLNSSNPVITFCTFNGNSTGGSGSVMYLNNSTPEIKNTIFWNNYATGTQPNIVITGNTTANLTNCCVQEAYAGTGNIFGDPQFIDADGADYTYGTSDDNLTLNDLSPCIGAGIATTASTVDILGITRGTPPDIGAYENSRDVPLPVELTSFSAQTFEDNVILKWTTATEVNNYGFEIERTLLNSPFNLRGETGGFEKLGFVAGAGSSNSPKEYSFIDINPVQGNAEYRLKQIDLDGNFRYYSNIAKINYLTAVKEKQIPEEFALSQNYPNPFNPSTLISYSIPEYPLCSNGVPLGRGVGGVLVTIKVYDILGNEVTTLVNENKAPGNYSVNFNAGDLPSGIYIYKLSAGNYTATKKLILMK